MKKYYLVKIGGWKLVMTEKEVKELGLPEEKILDLVVARNIRVARRKFIQKGWDIWSEGEYLMEED